MPLSRAPRNGSLALVRALGAVIRARRLRLKKTCADIALRSGLPEAEIVLAERCDPGLDLLQLAAIAAALEIPLRTLLRRAERKIRRGRQKRTPR